MAERSLVTARKPHALVVDDQPIICSMLRRELRSHFVVEIATSGADALARIRAGQPLALILCDLIMSDVSGFDVLDAVARERPELLSRFVCMSGRACTAEQTSKLASLGVHVIYKPFSRDELLRIVLRGS
jgi:CheY-like chemotaxis protein